MRNFSVRLIGTLVFILGSSLGAPSSVLGGIVFENYRFLGTLGGTISLAYGVNNSGQVVGYSYTSGDSTYHATRWDGSTITDLGTLGGSNSIANGINDTGIVVGYSETTIGVATYHATRWDGLTITDLDTLGGSNSIANGINDAGIIVGQSDTLGNSSSHATLWGSTTDDLGTLGGKDSFAYGINNAGQVVGYAYTAGNDFHATLWDGATTTDLGTLGGTKSIAYGINDAGQVVGYSFTSSDTAYRATLWNGSTITDLGTLGGTDSIAYGINGNGHIVGETDAGATLWINGTPTSLADYSGNLTASSFSDARAISNYDATGRFYVVGSGFNDTTGMNEAFIMTFRDTSYTPNTIPEPTSLAIFGLGFVGFAVRSLRRKGRSNLTSQ